MNPTSLNDNKVRRGVPDIAGNSAAASAYTGLLIGGKGFSYYGTSCAAPLYAGLAAVLNAALAEPIGFLNPMLYGLGTSVTNDVTTGNNDPADGSGAPYYTAGVGWDACTGWGSIEGDELLRAFQALFKKQVSFLIEQLTFSQDEVALQLPGVATFAAGWIAVDGFRPGELGLNSGNLGNPPASSIPDITISPASSLPPAVASAIQGMLKGPTFASPVLPVDPSLPNEPQRFLFPFVIQFTSDAGFLAMSSAVPPLTSAFITLSASLTVAGSTYQAGAEAELTTGENPRFEHLDPRNPTAFPTWQSFDLRLFKMTVPQNGSASRFDATVTGPTDAPAFIAAAAGNLTNGNGNVGGDTFDNGLSQDEDSSKIEFQQQDNNGNFVYNFALARVRITAKSAATARTVRVFFRLFQAQNTVSDFSENTTYRFASDGITFGHKIPRLGVQNDQNGNPEYVTIPCFATQRIVLVDRTKSMDDQDDPPNARDLATSPGEKDYYFGCWIDNNQPPQQIMPASPPPGNFDGPWPNTIQLSSMKDAVTAFPHQCLIAEIRYDDTPVPPGANTSTSDKLTQRNIAWLDGPNPGLDVSRRMVHPVQVRPTPAGAVNPDELMIIWGSTPQGSAAQFYLPALAAADILRLADDRYPGHALQLVDPHTVGCPADGVTFVPLPNGTALAAGLLSIDLSAGVRRGDAYTISVRQITDAAAAGPPPPPPQIAGARANAAIGARATNEKHIAWRQVSGGFQFVLTISTKQQLLLSEERLLAVLRWMLQATPHAKRWYPVLRRYVADVEGRVLGFGGNPGNISPSPTGDVPGLHHLPEHPHHPPRHEEREEITGKISGIIYDHFGDFDGFMVETEDGCRHRFYSRETQMLRLVRRAWLDRTRVSVVPERERPQIPRELILLTGGADDCRPRLLILGS